MLQLKKNSQGLKYLVMKEFATGTCRKGLPQGLKKIINDIAFPEKPLQTDISCSEFEKMIAPHIIQ